MTVEWSYSRKDLPGSPPGRDTLPQALLPAPLSFVPPPTAIISAEVPCFGRSRNLPCDSYWFSGGYMALEQQSLEFPCAVLVLCL